jgi:hypothetical protein
MPAAATSRTSTCGRGARPLGAVGAALLLVGLDGAPGARPPAPAAGRRRLVSAAPCR